MDGEFVMLTVKELIKRLEYLNRFNPKQRFWLSSMVRFMREHFPEWEETTFCQIPIYYHQNTYIAFSVSEEYFTLYTNQDQYIIYLKNKLPSTKFGKHCAKIGLHHTAAIPILFEAYRGSGPYTFDQPYQQKNHII
ncbi:hypothetical protein ACFP7A_06875 [Sporolactobacillus kofuensis]|uniref:YdhG-like domain-containing protein n=1 Tax=Sporolactobacillus kofuensis TaxID=269672 RepID=A0ABW1WCN1_9BACL|nr:hypothetical protein [Sporolactobacillus kofuensis]MCO7175370.1 hypothetical protein [Sporolactobacillus kofuensis]